MEKWPKMYKIKQIFNQTSINDIEEEINKELEYIIKGVNLSKGSKVAISAGSRGITNIVLILRSVVSKLQSLGYKPFLFSAMGSHGGGTEKGQLEILESLNITEQNIGCPVISSTEVVKIGETESRIKGLPVYTAKEAYEADAILVINRIKAHTSFTGDYESGLVKMMAVGMGRAKGASTVHKLGAELLAESIPSIASVVLHHAPVIGGIAILENSKEETAMIKGLKSDEIFSIEKGLLNKAKTYLPKLPVNNVDFLVINEMGKNFSGTGMDTNIIGRLRINGMKEPLNPKINYIAVLDLSEEAHGNATGIGLADFTTERLVRKIDQQSTYLNCITSGFVTRAAIPMTFKDDKSLFDGVSQVIRSDEPSKLKVIIIKNTLHLDELLVSESILQEIGDNPNLGVLEGPIELSFSKGKLQL